MSPDGLFLVLLVAQPGGMILGETMVAFPSTPVSGVVPQSLQRLRREVRLGDVYIVDDRAA